MPVLRQHLSLMLRRMSVFLNLEAGAVRGRPPVAGGRDGGARLLAEKDEEISRLRRRLIAGGLARGVRPENIIWMFGVARSGSSWLAAMMAELENHAMWYEPYVGSIFGHAYNSQAPDWQREREEFVMSNRHREVWLGSIRKFVLDGANARFPDLGEDGYLVIKEPNGSLGAPILTEAMPESRVILLVRDPRDVVASSLAASKEGGWAAGRQSDRSLADADPDAFVRQRASMCVASLGKAREAYEAHGGRKVLVRYEDLRYNTFEELKKIYAALDLPADERRLEEIVGRHDWEKIPRKRKGPDKFHRKARPGGWREDLTPGQVRAVEEIASPLIKAFYPG